MPAGKKRACAQAARIAIGKSAASLPYLPKAKRQAAKAYCGVPQQPEPRRRIEPRSGRNSRSPFNNAYSFSAD